MSEYAECTTCKYVNEKADGEHCKYCTLNACQFTLNYEPMTNADRIRNMTDEELAYFLIEEVDDVFDCCDCDEPESEYGSCIGDCKNPMLKWLQAEVEEGAE